MAQRKTRSKTKPLGEKTVKVLFKVQGYTTFMGENPKWRERCVDPKSPHKTLSAARRELKAAQAYERKREYSNPIPHRIVREMTIVEVVS